MQFTLLVKNVGDPDTAIWKEKFNKVTDDPEKWARDTIRYFNNTLRYGERARELVGVVVEKNDRRLEHSWYKTNLVTMPDGSDRYRCTTCGATGKRLALGGGIIPDRKKMCKEPTHPRSNETMAKKKAVVREPVWTKRLVKPMHQADGEVK